MHALPRLLLNKAAVRCCFQWQALPQSQVWQVAQARHVCASIQVVVVRCCPHLLMCWKLPASVVSVGAIVKHAGSK
jgi:hypothetical protein